MIPSVYGEITVAIQCVDGSRHQATFTDSTISLWTVLQEVGVVSQPRDGTPVVVYMNAEVCGEDALREKSLKDLGLTQGRAALRCVCVCVILFFSDKVFYGQSLADSWSIKLGITQ